MSRSVTGDCNSGLVNLVTPQIESDLEISGKFPDIPPVRVVVTLVGGSPHSPSEARLLMVKRSVDDRSEGAEVELLRVARGWGVRAPRGAPSYGPRGAHRRAQVSQRETPTPCQQLFPALGSGGEGFWNALEL